MGLEPTTPCLQSRCSSQLSYAPGERTAYAELGFETSSWEYVSNPSSGGAAGVSQPPDVASTLIVAPAVV